MPVKNRSNRIRIPTDKRIGRALDRLAGDCNVWRVTAQHKRPDCDCVVGRPCAQHQKVIDNLAKARDLLAEASKILLK